MDIEVVEKVIKASVEEALKRMRQAEAQLTKVQQGRCACGDEHTASRSHGGVQQRRGRTNGILERFEATEPTSRYRRRYRHLRSSYSPKLVLEGMGGALLPTNLRPKI